MASSIPITRVAAFHASMPRQYRSSFERHEMVEHAAIVDRRRGALARVELWRRTAPGAILCVVADDRPGLLSLISAALVGQGLDVLSAQTYVRFPNGRPAEAVDLITVQRVGEPGAPILEEDVARMGNVLVSLISGEITVETAVSRSQRVRISALRVEAPARVTFTEALDESVTMTVEAADRPGLLLAITHALYRGRVQIIASSAETREGRATDRFTLQELDGTPLLDRRRRAIEFDVLAAVGSRPARPR